MTLEDLVYELGDNVEVKDAQVQDIVNVQQMSRNVWVQVRVLNPRPVSDNRADTWVAKLDEAGTIKCILQPENFSIADQPTFIVQGAKLFPDQDGNLVEAILAEIKAGDSLKVLHIIDPPKHPGKYCRATT